MPVLGVLRSPPEETSAAVDTAVATGHRLIDTAAAYGKEREVGNAAQTSRPAGVVSSS